MSKAADRADPVRPLVLVVDDEPGVRASVRAILERECEVLEAGDGGQALELATQRPVDVCLLDLRLPGIEGLTVLERLKRLDPSVEVVLVTVVRTVRTAVEAIKLGAYDYVTKPFGVDELRVVVRRALEHRRLQREVHYLRDELARREGFDELVGASPAMQRVYELVRQVAGSVVTVLISGESGTGKELIARAIHRLGPRRDRPFVAVNCAAIPSELMESELFGHERGAFTGAHARRLGKFELAHTGTLLLDEVATLRWDLQPKLLRVLQEREVERIGAGRPVRVDVRLIAATNADLRRAVAEGSFREDLYYRLNVVPITVPPLRERPEDIPLLVDHFRRKYARRFGKPVRAVTPAALDLLQRYPWPGNVRELENIIERMVVLARGDVIERGDLPLDLALEASAGTRAASRTFRAALQEFERQFLLRTLHQAGGNQSVAARRLGLHRNTLAAKLHQLGLRGGGGAPRGGAAPPPAPPTGPG